jgi:site-specific recombinase XerD
MESRGGIFERPRGSGMWWIDFRDSLNGRHREKIGRRAEAAQAYNRRLEEVRTGKYANRVQGKISFGELAREALEAKRIRLAPLSYETDLGRLNLLLPELGAVPAADLAPELLEKIFGRMRSEQNLSGSTVNRYRSLLSSIYSFAVRTGRLQANPLARVKRFKENASRVRYLKNDEEILLRAVIKSTCPEREPELDLALFTGMRRGEQFKLKWADVDLERGILTVNGKTGQRHIVVNSRAAAAIERLKSETNGPNGDTKYVCSETTDDSKRDNRRWLENAANKAGLDNFHWHDLRHTFASRLVMAGVDIRTVQELMGHKSIVMTMRYAHLSPDHRAAAAEKIGGLPVQIGDAT